ncbi:unnamed protein product [Linum tenue]|uniref:Oleosin n=3 Tax=Linum tenue TaxID=586396 RepID=A0AAV0MSD8_9ROSI|nr:unnamed protein product [Linum tenue]
MDPSQQHGSTIHQQQQQSQPRSYQVVKAATAATAGGSMLVLSGLILAATVIVLTIATPLLVIFSPVLVPALVTVGLITTGFLASGGFGIAAITVLSWIYRVCDWEAPTGRGFAGPSSDEAGREGEGDEGQGDGVRAAACHRSADLLRRRNRDTPELCMWSPSFRPRSVERRVMMERKYVSHFEGVLILVFLLKRLSMFLLYIYPGSSCQFLFCV